MLMSTLAFYIPSKNTIYLAKNDFATGIEFGVEQPVKFIDAPTVKCVPLADFDCWTILFATDEKTTQLVNEIKHLLNQESIAVQKHNITSDLM